MSAAPRSRHEERLEDRRKQIAACLEGLIYGNDVNLDTPIHSRTPRPPAARHLAPTKRQREAQALGTPPHSAETRPTCKGRCSARPVAAGGATSGDSQLRHAEAATGPTVAALTAHVRQQLRALAPHEHFGFARAAGLLRGEAAAACAAAPQVVLHPFDPYAPRADRRSAVGWRRRGELSVFNDDGAPLTLDVALAARGKALGGLEVRALYADAVVEECAVRRLVAVLDALVKAVATAPGDTPVDALLRRLDEESIAELGNSISLVKKED